MAILHPENPYTHIRTYRKLIVNTVRVYPSGPNTFHSIETLPSVFCIGSSRVTTFFSYQFLGLVDAIPICDPFFCVTAFRIFGLEHENDLVS